MAILWDCMEHETSFYYDMHSGRFRPDGEPSLLFKVTHHKTLMYMFFTDVLLKVKINIDFLLLFSIV